jgi:low-density lipoprotein receptor class B
MRKIITIIMLQLFVVSMLSGQTYIYWTDTGYDSIGRSDLDGTNQTAIKGNGTCENPRGIAIDEINGHIYYSDDGGNKIVRMDMDGSNSVDLVTTNVATPAGIELDVGGGKMYWTDTGSTVDQIKRADLDGSNVETIVTLSSENAYGIALDLVNGHIYWTQTTVDKIVRADLDGGNITDIITSGLSNPYGIVLDVSNNYMYWTEYTSELIRRATLSGGSQTTLLTSAEGLDNPRGICIDFVNSNLYWADIGLGEDHIAKCDLDGSNVTVVLTGLSSSYFFDLYGVGATTTFTGTGNWSTGTRWSYGLPGGTNVNGTISGTCIVDGDYSVEDLTVSSGNSLTISSANSLEVNGTLSVAGTLTIESDATGTGALIESSGVTATVERYITEDVYHYLSSPVSNQAISLLQSGTAYTDFDLYWYDEDKSGGGGPAWIDASAQGGNMDVGLGYAYTYNPANRTISFSGITNTGTHTEAVTYTYDAGVSTDQYYFGWNLIGNPYPTRINATTFIDDADNSNIDGTLQFWDEAASFADDRNDYASWNKTGSVSGGGGNTPNGYIGVGQAFMVHYGSGTGQTSSSIKFKNSMKATNAAQFFKSKETVKRFKISLENEDAGYNEVLVGFLDGTTTGFDNKYDGYKLSGNPNIKLYTKLVDSDGKGYAIQGLPPTLENVNVDLCYKAGIEGVYTFKVVDFENFSDDDYVYLEDMQENVIVDLKKNPEYAITVNNTGTFENRFHLRFTKGPLGIEDDESVKQNFNIYSDDSKIVVNNMNTSGAYEIYVYNISGQLMMSQKLNNNSKNELSFNQTPGIYVIKLVGENQVYSTKINHR